MFVSVCGMNQQPVRFKITERTKMGRVMRSYGERRGVESANLQFVFDGGLIGDKQTAQQLHLHDGDSIDAIICGTCWNCGVPAASLLRCAQCKLSKYCSQTCQRRCVLVSCCCPCFEWSDCVTQALEVPQTPVPTTGSKN